MFSQTRPARGSMRRLGGLPPSASVGTTEIQLHRHAGRLAAVVVAEGTSIPGTIGQVRQRLGVARRQAGKRSRARDLAHTSRASASTLRQVVGAPSARIGIQRSPDVSEAKSYSQGRAAPAWTATSTVGRRTATTRPRTDQGRRRRSSTGIGRRRLPGMSTVTTRTGCRARRRRNALRRSAGNSCSGISGERRARCRAQGLISA
mmetsp:Transcript_30781/g.89397  ORF Transcript_30781/g.89397 Transcript_30781/m.89397 type:complete len:204 (+) Transcript_30781:1106-1717(+)